MKKSLVGAVALGLMLTSSADAKIYSSYVPQATAECMDGKFSDAPGSGACSGKHGGVKRWLRPTKLDKSIENLRNGGSIYDKPDSSGNYARTTRTNSRMGNDLESREGIIAEQRKGYSLSDIGAERDRRAASRTVSSSGLASGSANSSMPVGDPVSEYSSVTSSNETVVDNAPLENTGGEPLLMTMIGTSIAGAALFLRRRVRSQ